MSAPAKELKKLQDEAIRIAKELALLAQLPEHNVSKKAVIENLAVDLAIAAGMAR